jgi:phosphate-selective porin
VTVRPEGRLELVTTDFVGRGDGTDLHVDRKRLGISGSLFEVVDFQVERELEHDWDPWRDVFVRVRPSRALGVRAGKFKVPFSRARLDSSVDVPTIVRPLAAESLAPGRQIGVAVEGALFDRAIEYEGGVFRETLAQSFGQVADPGGSPLGAARLNVRAFRGWLPALDDIELGLAATMGERPEGLASVVGYGVADASAFFPEVWVKGRRLRTGFELSWSRGPVGVAGEYMEVREERREQGLRGQDLSDLVSSGWYGSGVWRVFGPRRDRDRPMSFAPFVGRPGTLEVVARVEALRFASATTAGTPFRNPRADHVVGNGEHVLTFGTNWYFSRFGRIQLNAIGERVEDAARSPIGSDHRFWSVVTRLQFHL